jgi:TRAP-type mannitol/chloroaromatic compound transport system permease small subunit
LNGEITCGRNGEGGPEKAAFPVPAETGTAVFREATTGISSPRVSALDVCSEGGALSARRNLRGKNLHKFIKVVDAISDWSGKLLGLLVLPLVGGLVYEVFARYLFNAPTVWAYEVTYMLYGAIFMLGAAYTLYKKSHIRTDILYNKWTPRQKGIADAIMYLFLFFPGIVLFLILGCDYAWHAWEIAERSDSSPWRQPIYPFKMAIPLSAFLLLLQGVSEFLKALYSARHGRTYES